MAVLAGNGWLGLWYGFFMLIGGLPGWGGYEQSDVAAAEGDGMLGWLVGPETTAPTPTEVAARQWCWLWARGLVWLGPAGAGLRRAGFSSTGLLAGGLLPAAFALDRSFAAGRGGNGGLLSEIAPGPTEGLFFWGAALWWLLIGCLLGRWVDPYGIDPGRPTIPTAPGSPHGPSASPLSPDDFDALMPLLLPPPSDAMPRDGSWARRSGSKLQRRLPNGEVALEGGCAAFCAELDTGGRWVATAAVVFGGAGVVFSRVLTWL